MTLAHVTPGGVPTMLQATRDLLQSFTPYSAEIKPTWTVGEVRTALNGHERGDFRQSALLADAMGRDDRLNGILETRIRGLLGADVELQPPEEHAEDPAAIAIAEELQTEYFEIFPEDDLADLLRWRILMGFSLGQLVWERKATEWVARLRVWHPMHVWFEEDSATWHVNTREGDVIIEPGNGTWILMGRGDRPYMHGAMRGLAIPWLVRQFGMRDWARWSERHGMPIVKAMVPAVADGDDKTTFMRDVRALSTETTVKLPQNIDDNGASYDLQLLEAKDKSWDGFKALLDQMSDAFAVALLGNNLTSEVRGGSFAAANVGDAVRDDIQKSDAQELTTTLRNDGLVWVVSLNHENGAELTPWPVYQVEPPEDLKAKADALVAAGLALERLIANQIPVDLQAISETFGIPLVESDLRPGQQVFQYHLDFGILTVNETRRRLGLEPVPGGDVRALPSLTQGVPDGGGNAQPDQQLSWRDRQVKRRVSLQSGDNPADASGFIDGQDYADRLATDSTRRAQRTMDVDLKDVMEILETSTTPEDMKNRLIAKYQGMDAIDLASVLEKASILSDMAGRFAVLQDV